MIYQESKNRNENDEYTYTVEDVFGIIKLYAKEKLDADALDSLVVHILKIETPQGEINITYGKQSKQQLTVKYTYEATNKWGENDDPQSVV